ncbi:hypothetical protein NDU88_002235 [Pleurodeles waltl]|uniref:Uncharacterized protein n=1 Tax=Pleurodeles waltl TaxID=8319 RepID=A0AAV7TKK9_PLEWA|nr:hypothetical protein NDU88_002235 [Pleurodeles waltl]
MLPNTLCFRNATNRGRDLTSVGYNNGKPDVRPTLPFRCPFLNGRHFRELGHRPAALLEPTAGFLDPPALGRHPVAPPQCAAGGLCGLSPLSRSDAIKGRGYVSPLIRRSPLHRIPSPQSFADRRAYALCEQGDVPQHKRRDSAYSFAVFPHESAGPTAPPDREESPELGPGPVWPTAAAPLPQHRRFKFTPPQLSGGLRSCR